MAPFPISLLIDVLSAFTTSPLPHNEILKPRDGTANLRVIKEPCTNRNVAHFGEIAQIHHSHTIAIYVKLSFLPFDDNS